MSAFDIGDALEEAYAAIDRVRARTGEVRATAAGVRARAKEADAGLAERRRKGELGRAWQVLQGRIDMNTTTQADIYSGVDLSSEAREVRASLGKALGALKPQLEEQQNDPEVVAVHEELQDAQEALRQAFQRLNQAL